MPRKPTVRPHTFWHETLLELMRIPVHLAFELEQWSQETLEALLCEAIYREIVDRGMTMEEGGRKLGVSDRTLRSFRLKEDLPIGGGSFPSSFDNEERIALLLMDILNQRGELFFGDIEKDPRLSGVDRKRLNAALLSLRKLKQVDQPRTESTFNPYHLTGAHLHFKVKDHARRIRAGTTLFTRKLTHAIASILRSTGPDDISQRTFSFPATPPTARDFHKAHAAWVRERLSEIDEKTVGQAERRRYLLLWLACLDETP